MLARAAIDARSLVDLLVGPPRTVTMNHKELTAAIRDHSVLVVTGPRDEEELKDAISKQDFDVRKLWVETIKELRNTARYRHATPGLSEPVSALCDQALPAELCTQTDFIVVGAAVAVRKGFDGTGYSQSPGEPEQVTADAVAHCQTIKRIRELKERGNYPSGADRDLVWREIFAPLAAASREVTILDRYLLRGLANQGNTLRHVQWILDKLDATMPDGGTVRLLSETPDETLSLIDYDALLRRSPLQRRRMRVRSIQVVLAPWRDRSGKRGPHNRHLRFSCGSAIGVEEGFDRFKASVISGVDGLTWKHYTHSDSLHGLSVREAYVLAHSERINLLML